MSQILKDIQAESRYLRKRTEQLSVSEDGKECMISSTRKKRKRTGNLDNPVEYLAGIVVGRLPKQEIKRDQPHNPIWKKPTPDGIMKYVGYREIINKAFLDGFYDK